MTFVRVEGGLSELALLYDRQHWESVEKQLLATFKETRCDMEDVASVALVNNQCARSLNMWCTQVGHNHYEVKRAVTFHTVTI